MHAGANEEPGDKEQHRHSDDGGEARPNRTRRSDARGCGPRGGGRRGVSREGIAYREADGFFFVARIDDGDGSDESVTAAGEGLDEARILGGVAEGFAQFIDGGAEAVVEVDDGVVAPELELNFFAGDDFGGALKEANEEAEGLGLEANADAGFAQFSRFSVGFKKSEAKTGGRIFLLLNGGGHKCLRAGQDITFYR